MTTESPTLADQVSKLYDLIAGYHATHMIEIGHQLVHGPRSLGFRVHLRRTRCPYCHRRLLHRCPVSHRVAFEIARPGRGRLANGAAFRTDPRDPESSSIWLPRPGSTWKSERTTRTTRVISEKAQFVRIRSTMRRSCVKSPRHSRHCRGSSSIWRCLNSRSWQQRLEEGGRVLDVGCEDGPSCRSPSAYRASLASAIDVEPISVGLAQRLISARGLADRCEARAITVDQLDEAGTFDVVTSFPGGPRDSAGTETRSIRPAVAKALKPGWRLPHLRRGLPGHQRSPLHHAYTLCSPGPVVRADLGKRCRYPSRSR